MYKSVSHKHQIGDYQVYETISRTINLTNIISILVHYCIKTYFQPWSHSSPTPFLMKRKSCRFNIGLASISVSLYTPSRHTPSRHTPSPKMYRFNFGNPFPEIDILNPFVIDLRRHLSCSGWALVICKWLRFFDETKLWFNDYISSYQFRKWHLAS